MYLEFYKLKEKPFSLTPDPSFLFYSNAHRRAIAFLKYGLQESKGFLQLTGPVGSGKTTLLRAVLAGLDERTKTAYIINPCAPFPDLLRSIMKDLEIPGIPETRLKIELLDFFHDYLLLQMRRSQPVIVIFDEAQNLSVKNLEEIRMLSNFETPKDKLLQIVFVGQPELIRTLDLPELRQLKQRIQVRYHLSPLNQPEVQAYINHRLHVAGSNGEIVFSEDACKAIYDFSGGIPRLINSVCDVMLLIGYVNERKEFDSTAVKEAISEMSGAFSDEQIDTGSGKDSAEAVATAESRHDKTEPTGDARQPLNAGAEGRRPGDSDAKPAPDIRDLSSDKPDSNLPTLQTSMQASSPSAEKATASDGRPFDSLGASQGREEEKGTQADNSIREVPERPSFEVISETHVSSQQESEASSKGHGVSLGQTPRHVSFDASRVPGSGFLHALLRYGPKGKFRAVSGGSKNLAGPRGNLAAKITGFLYGQKLQVKAVHETDAPDGENGSFSRGVSGEHSGLATGEQLADSERLRAEVTCNRIMILFKDGSVAKGISKGLDLENDGFYFSPRGKHGTSAEDFTAFERIVAVRPTNDFAKDWERKCEVSSHLPKGREIIVSLVNGETVEGITPDTFAPELRRFYVISTYAGDKATWTLIERSGTSGILTESFREGIYSGEAIGLPDPVTSSKAASDPGWQYETAGDFYFSMRDYDSALLEYRKAWEITKSVKRIILKISLSHFERGMKCMESHKYHDAMKEFEKVVASDYLRNKARGRVKEIKKMLRA